MVLGYLVRSDHGNAYLADPIGLTAALAVGLARVRVDLDKDGHCKVTFEDGERGRSYELFRDNLFRRLEQWEREGRPCRKSCGPL
jgi:hypothetical protein